MTRLLKKEERILLYRKYISSGLDPDSANLQVEMFIAHLINLKDKLKEQKKTDVEINTKFKEEFFNLCQKLET